MPARLDRPATLKDIRLYDEDIGFLAPVLAARNITLNEYVRDLVHRACNAKRVELGMKKL